MLRSLVGSEMCIRDSLYVDPEKQCMGVGTSLLRHATDEFQRAGRQLAWIETEEDNTLAQRFYQKHGGRTTGMVVGRDGDVATIGYRWVLNSPTTANPSAQPA